MANPRIWKALEIGTNVTAKVGARLRDDALDDADIVATIKDGPITRLSALMISGNGEWYGIVFGGRIVYVKTAQIIVSDVRYYPIDLVDQALTVLVNDVLRRVVAGIPAIVTEGVDNG